MGGSVMIRSSALYGIVCVLLLLALKATSAQQAVLPEFRYHFLDVWRLGAPVFAWEELPVVKSLDPIIYSGKMTPRGMLILRAGTGMAAGQQGRTRVVRSAQVDITRMLTVRGATHIVGEKAEFVPAQDLPPLRVTYDPATPAELTLPTDDRTTVVLLYELGEDTTAWKEGTWLVTLQLDATMLNCRLSPDGLKGIIDPRAPDGHHILYKLRFKVAAIKEKADEMNYLVFRFRDERAKHTKESDQRALDAITTVLREYPRDGALLYERASLHQDMGAYASAIRDAEEIIRLSAANQVSRSFIPPIDGYDMTPEERIDWLRQRIAFWKKQ